MRALVLLLTESEIVLRGFSDRANGDEIKLSLPRERFTRIYSLVKSTFSLLLIAWGVAFVPLCSASQSPGFLITAESQQTVDREQPASDRSSQPSSSPYPDA